MRVIVTFGILILWILFLFFSIFIVLFDYIEGKNYFYETCDWFVEILAKIWLK